MRFQIFATPSFHSCQGNAIILMAQAENGHQDDGLPYFRSFMTIGKTVDYFVNTVFNYPTLAEAYKVAALDGVNRLDM